MCGGLWQTGNRGRNVIDDAALCGRDYNDSVRIGLACQLPVSAACTGSHDGVGLLAAPSPGLVDPRDTRIDQ